MPILLFPPPGPAVGPGGVDLDPVDVEIEIIGPPGAPVEVTTDPVDVAVEIPGASAAQGTADETAGEPWAVFVGVTRPGEVGVQVVAANPSTITKPLNAEAEAEFVLAKGSPNASLVVPMSEVVIRRGTRAHFEGPVLGDGVQSGSGEMSYSARDPYWYMRSRFFGAAGRTNRLLNGGFESGLSSWRAVGTTPAIRTSVGGVTPLSGSKMAVGFVAPSTNTYLVQRRAYRTEHPGGQYVTVTAWVYLYAYAGPAAFGLGLLLSRVVAGKITRQAVVTIDDETPRGQWVKLKTGFSVKPFTDGVLDVRLYFPGGVTFYDRAGIFLMESSGSSYLGNTRGEIASRVIRYAQTSPLDDVGLGVNFASTSPTLLHRNWQHEQHDPIDGAFEGLASDPDGFDFDVPVSTRTLTSYHPRKAIASGVTLKLGSIDEGGNLVSYSRPRDGAGVATDVIVKAPGDGPDREEGYATSGLTPKRELVVAAPDDLPIDSLDDYAAQILAENDEPVTVVEVVTHEGTGNLVDTLEPGSLVTLDIVDGDVVIDGEWRIVRLVIHCKDDTMTLTLNPS